MDQRENARPEGVRGALATAALLLVGLVVPSPAVSAKEAAQDLSIGERVTIRSEVLGEDREVFVAFPAGYRRSEARYPVLYVLDGEFFFYQVHAAVQFLSECTYLRTPPVPQMLVVGIVNVDRNRDLTPTHAPVQGPLRYPTSGGSQKFLSFLRSELMPFIDANYRTRPYRVLSGWSFGGLFTVKTFLDSPGAFSAYLAISPSLWWEQDAPVKQAAALARRDALSRKPLVVTVGTQEGGDIGRSVRDGFFPILRDVGPPPLSFSAVEIPDGDHYFSPGEAFFDGLQALFADWELPQEALSGGLDGVVGFYKQLSARVGYPVDVPEPAYHALISSLIASGDDAAALKIARMTRERFPTSSRAVRTLGVMLERTGDVDGARSAYLKAIEVEKALPEPDSERIMDARLLLWVLDNEPPPAPAKDD